jgi:hypothetical protein
MSGIIELSKRNDATVNELLLVGRLLRDTSTHDPNPGTYHYGPAILIPKMKLSVMACARDFLPNIAKNSPKALLELVNSLSNLPSDDKQAAIDILNNMKLKVLAIILMTLVESELQRACSELKGQGNHRIQSLVDAFSASKVEQPSWVINCIAADDIISLVSLPEDLAQMGSSAIPFLLELVKYNTEHPHKLGFMWEVRLSTVFHFSSVKYVTALYSIAILQRIGPQSKNALVETAKSHVRKIRLASEKALKQIDIS